MMGGAPSESSNTDKKSAIMSSSPVADLAYSSDPNKPAVILLAGLQGAGEFCPDEIWAQHTIHVSKVSRSN